eukprot:6211348-Pleurochrysis_carterae.AAC.2
MQHVKKQLERAHQPLNVTVEEQSEELAFAHTRVHIPCPQNSTLLGKQPRPHLLGADRFLDHLKCLSALAIRIGVSLQNCICAGLTP